MMLLPLLVIACVGYIVYAVVDIRREMGGGWSGEDGSLHPCAKYVFVGLVPTGVCVTMVYLFWFVGGATTVQFNAGSSSRMNAWSTWVELWPAFLLLTTAGSVAGLVWLVTCGCSRKFRPRWPVGTWCLLLSALAFLTVVSYFPSA